jgi:hypothetical protein
MVQFMRVLKNNKKNKDREVCTTVMVDFILDNGKMIK